MDVGAGNLTENCRQVRSNCHDRDKLGLQHVYFDNNTYTRAQF
jgi:hypothetical protein